MGRRGTNAFKRNDAIRSVESARAAGIGPRMLEVVVKATAPMSSASIPTGWRRRQPTRSSAAPRNGTPK
jgi:hypothetical protein